MTVPTQTAAPLPVERGREGRGSRAPAQARSLLARLVGAARAEAALFGIGVGVVTVHVVDDNFLQPQPGTSAGDHLISGLVPLAVLVVVAMFYSRLRPGLRASLAVTIGIFGLVVGIEGAYYAHAGRLAGDDYTGLVAIPAGLFLISIGVTTLWQASGCWSQPQSSSAATRRLPRS